MEQLALVFGEPLDKLPKDLYIPPDALRVLLLSFEGPLDLLLYLIRKDNFDIKNIPIAEITTQYLQYIDMMQKTDISLAAEYLLMAATLAEIKAKMLLPRAKLELQNEYLEDPRNELTQQLITYAQIKRGALNLENMPRVGKDIFLSALNIETPLIPPSPDKTRLLQAMTDLFARQSFYVAHKVESETITLATRLLQMEQKLNDSWQNLCIFQNVNEGREGFILSLMAMLEMDKSQLLEWQQHEMFAEIFIKKR